MIAFILYALVQSASKDFAVFEFARREINAFLGALFVMNANQRGWTQP